MIWMEPVQKRFDRIECCARNFHKKGDPIRHAAIPQPWPFQGFERTPLIGFMRNEAGIRITEIQKIKGVALIISNPTDHVDRIEVCCRSEQLPAVIPIQDQSGPVRQSGATESHRHVEPKRGRHRDRRCSGQLRTLVLGGAEISSAMQLFLHSSKRSYDDGNC